ncbi:Bug family tripartite tricarboxylate transporter substrate binding protein [Noviherbaspirillum humi]|nr:tripartite tricarboxylate transporter substrate binding protein [Noviherbaspirillum humi]
MALAAVAAVAAGLPLSSALAQSDYPSKPIHVIVPYTPGGGVDIVTRLVTQKMSVLLKQTIIVENKPGAATNIGMESTVRAEPDGYTLLTASNTLASNAALFPNLSFDPARDLIPVGSIGYAPLVVVVPQNSTFKTLPDLIAYGKANPDKLSYGSAGNGSSGHLASELLKAEGGFDALHIPYKGGAPAITDLLGDRISFMSINPLEVISHIQSGKLRALAVLDKDPTPLLPNVPSARSLQLPGSYASVWWGLVGPKNMPADAVNKLNAALRQTLADPAVVKRMGELGAVVTPGTPADFGNFVKAETVKWTKVIKTAKIKAD